MQETRVWSLGWEDPLEEGMATHSSILAWRIPWTEESVRLRPMVLQRAGHTWSTCCEELTHLKRPWCWERWKAGGEGDGTGWDSWMASPTPWTWVWVSSGSWWWTGGLVCCGPWGCKESDHDWVTELNWSDWAYENNKPQWKEYEKEYMCVIESLCCTAEASTAL